MFLKKKNLIIGGVIFVLTIILASYFNLSSEKLPASSEVKEYSLPIIMYHSVREDESYSGKYVITPKLLREDIEYLLQCGYTPIGVGDIINFTENDLILPEKPILLTFDDGYYNNYAYVFPLLKEYGIKAVFSVVGYYTQNYSLKEQATAYSYLTWEQIKELNDSSLVEIGNHSYNMHDSDTRMGIRKKEGESTEEYVEAISSDITKMQDLLKENCGIDCIIFTYPFGNYDKTGAQTIKDLGFVCSLSCEEGINTIQKGSDLHLLKRYNRESGVSSQEYFQRIGVD